MRILSLVTIIMLFCLAAYGELDVSEPRTVGLVYVVPHGRKYNQDMVDKLKEDILIAQQFFASELERHGYGYLEFKIERDTDDEPLVHFIQMQEGEDLGRVLLNSLKLEGNIFLIVFDEGVFRRGWAVSYHDDREPTPMSEEASYIILPSPSRYSYHTLYHELGHAFRLEHDFKNKQSIMSWSSGAFGNEILKCQAATLAMHPYFNHDIPLDETVIVYAGVPWVSEGEELILPTIDGIEIDLPDTYTHADESIPITVKVNNPNGVYHVSLETVVFIDCRHGSGGVNETFTFDYDGYQDHDTLYALGAREYHILGLDVIDMAGNLYTSHVITWRDDTISREDINVDGIINVLDLIIVANHISNSTFDTAADVNSDGVINVLDLIAVSQAIQ